MKRSGRRVAILGHVRRPEVREAARRLRRSLTRAGHEVRLELELARVLNEEGTALTSLARWCDLMVCLGGDGTALTGGRAMYGRRGALLAVNLGGLGFLAAAEQHETTAAVRDTLDGSWRAVARRLVEVSVLRGGRRTYQGRAMNDAVVRHASGLAAIQLNLVAAGADLGLMVADGVVIASPAGSTAYSLSAGGPVLDPELDALVITPVCPHSLGSRALVLSRREDLRMKVLGSPGGVLLLDGHDRSSLLRGDDLVFSLTRGVVRWVQRPGCSWASLLRSKLGWQGAERRSL